MANIVFKEHNFTAIIRKYSPIGEELKGMRSGKPFLRNGQIMINVDNKLCLVKDIEFKDDDNGDMLLSDVNIDTDLRIAGVVIVNDEVLLQRRVKDGKEYFVFPGGHRGVKENEIETLRREMLEELGLDINVENAELLTELHQEGFGPEKFFLVKGDLDFSQLKKSNPDTPEDEICEAVLMKLAKVKKMENAFPKAIIKKI